MNSLSRILFGLGIFGLLGCVGFSASAGGHEKHSEQGHEHTKKMQEHMEKQGEKMVEAEQNHGKMHESKVHESKGHAKEVSGDSEMMKNLDVSSDEGEMEEFFQDMS